MSHMNQFKTIFRFELGNYFKNKVFVGTTIVLMILLSVIMFFPKISGLVKGSSDSGEQKVMLLSSGDPALTQMAQVAFEKAFPDYQITITDQDAADIRDKINDGTADCGFLLQDAQNYTYFVKNLSMYDANPEIADQILRGISEIKAMTEAGLSPERAGSILATEVSHTVEATGKDQSQNFFYTYIMIFALYMVILLYGQMVSTSVATEKSSRAMELLVTSADPVKMMFGKVLAACLAGLVQLLCVFGTAFLLFNLTRSDWADNKIVTSIFDIPLHLLLFMLVFFILGFLIYAFLYGAVGSTVSKLEDINTAIMPITFLFIIAFIVVMTALGSGEVDNLPMLVCSFIPFTSPMAMFTRIAMSTVPSWQITISIAILAVSVFGTGVLAARIYRVGVLLYGTTPKPAEVLRMIWKGR